MKKFLSYICTFVLMFVMSAAITVWSSSIDNKGSITPPIITGGASSSSLFTGILESFQEEKKISVNGQVIIRQQNADDLPLDISLNLDLTDSNNLKIDGFIAFNLFEKLNIIQFSYYDFCFYLSFNDINLKIEQSTFVGFAGALSQLIPVQTSGFDINTMIEQLMPTIMNALDQIQEEELESGDKLSTLEIENLVSVKILTDCEGVLKSIDLTTGYFEGFAIDGRLNIDFQQSLVIENPENPSVEGLRKEYYDVEKLVNIVDNTTRLKNIFANVNIDLLDSYIANNIEFNVLANTDENNYRIELLNNSYGYVDQLNFTYLNDDIYANVNDVYLFFNKELVNDVHSLLGNQSLTENISANEIEKTTSNILTSIQDSLSQDINNIFDLIKHLSIKNNTITLMIDGAMLGFGNQTIELLIGFNEQNITSLTINGVEVSGQTLNISVELEVTEEKVYIENAENYIDISQIYSENKALFESDMFDLDFEVEYNNHLVNGNLKLKSNLSYIELTVSYLENDLYIVVDEQFAYVKLNDIKIKVDSKKIKDFILNNIDMGSLSYQKEIEEQLTNIIEDTSITDIVSLVSMVERISLVNGDINFVVDSSLFGLSGLLELNIKTEDNLLKSICVNNLNYKENQINAFIGLNGTSFTRANINTEDYLDLFKLKHTLENVRELKNASISLQTNILNSSNIYSLGAEASFDLSQKYLNLSLLLEGTYNFEIDASVYNGTVYANYKDVFVQAKIQTLLGLIEELTKGSNATNFKTDSLKEQISKLSISSNISTLINNFNLETLKLIKKIEINANQIYVIIDSSVLQTDNDLELLINFDNYKITEIKTSQIKLDNDLIVDLDVKIDYSEVIVKEINQKKYLDVESLIESTIALKDLKEGSAYLDGEVKYKENKYDIYLSAFANLNQDYLKLGVELADFDMKIDASLYDNTAFVKLNELYLQFTQSDISDILNLLGLDLKENQMLKMSNLSQSIENNNLLVNLSNFISNFNIKDLDKIKQLTINGSNIIVTIDKQVLGTEKDFTLRLSIVDGVLRSVEISQLDITEDLSIRFNLALYRNKVQKEEVNKDRYFKVKEAVEQVVNNLDKTQLSLDLRLDAIVDNKQFGLNVDANLDILKEILKANLSIDGLEQFDINAILYNEIAFVNINDIFVKLGLNDIDDLTALYGNDNSQIKQITGQLEQNELINKLKAYLNNLSISNLKDLSIKVEYNKIKLILNKEVLETKKDVVVEISILGNNKFGIKISAIEVQEDIKLSLSGVVDFNGFETIEVEPNKYLDVLQTAQHIKNITELRQGTLSAAVNTKVNGQTYNMSFNLDANLDINYYNLAFNLTGDKKFNLNINYYNNLMFANIKDIFVKLDFEELQKIMKTLGIKVSFAQDTQLTPDMILGVVNGSPIVQSVSDFVNNISLDSLKAVKTLNVTSSAITIIVDKQAIGSTRDLKIIISLYNGCPMSVEFFRFDINEEIDVAFKINLYQRKVNPLSVTNKKYLDVAGLLNNIINIENEKNISIEGFANIYDLNYNKLLGLDLEIDKLLKDEELAGKLLLSALYDNEYYKLDTTLLNEDLFLSFANLDFVIDVDLIQEQIVDILEKLTINSTNVNSYLDVIVGLMNNQTTLRDIFKLFNFNMNDTELSMGDIGTLDIVGLISQIISTTKINKNQIVINIDKSLLGLENNLDLIIKLTDNKPSFIDINNLAIDEKIIDCEIGLEYNKLEQISKPEKEFIKVTDIYNLFDATYNTIKNGTISGQVELKFDFLKELHTVTADYGIRIVDGDIQLKVTTKFKGLDVNVYFINQIIYLEIVGLKVYVEFDDLDHLFAWIETNYGVKVDVDTKTIQTYLGLVKDFDIQNIANGNKFDILQILGFISTFDLKDYIENLTIGKTKTEIDFVGGVQFDVTYKELGAEGNIVTDLYLEYNEMSMDVDCTAFTDFNMGLVQNDFLEYSEVLPIIDSVTNTINSKQYKVEVDASLVKDEEVLYDINASMSLDILNGFGSNIFLKMSGLQNINLSVDYYDEMLYVNYDSLRLSISQSAFQELFGIVAGLIGLDDDMSGMLGSAAVNQGGFTNENLQSLIPNLDLDNPLNMLKFIQSINATENSISVSIKGEFLSSPKPLTLNLVVNDGKIDKLEVIDVYSNGEFYNIALNFEEFTGIQKLSNENEYIDVSNSTDLIKALINTSELNDYHISGKVNLAIGLGSLELNAAAVEVDIQIKLDENNKPIIKAEIGNYPLIGLVNNKNTNAVGGIDSLTMRERKIYIYYQDGWCYLRTNDEDTKLFGTNEYDRMTKVTVNYLFNNLNYYMQWLLGFTDTIQNKINESIINSMNSPEEIDMSNVLLNYKKENGFHIIELNLQEISKNNDLGSIIIELSTINNESTGNKDYLYQLGIKMNMLDNFIILKTDNDNILYLVDIGKELDFTNVYNYMNSYPYLPYGEYTKEGEGSYSQTNTNYVTITVDNGNGESVKTYTDLAGKSFAITNPTYIKDDGISKTTYKFLGYYDQNGKLFTQNYYGAENVTITAKWEVESVVYYRTMTLITNGKVETIKKLAGEKVLILPYDTVVEDKMDGIYTTEFLGWFDAPENGNRIYYTSMPDYDTTIYAYFNTTVRKYVYVVYNLGGVADNYQTRYLENETATLVNAQNYNFVEGNIKTAYNFVDWYSDSSCSTLSEDSFEITQNVEVFAKWEVVVTEGYTITIYDGDTQVMQEIVTYVEGQNIPFSNSVRILDGVKWYTDANYSNLYSEDKEVIMPRQDLTLYVRNKYSLTIVSEYGTVTNQTYNNIYQGDDITQYIPTQASYDSILSTEKHYYTFEGYDYNSNKMANNNLIITAKWNVESWYLISFNTKTTGNSSANKNATTYDSVWKKKGETFDLSSYKPTAYYYKYVVVKTNIPFLYWTVNGERRTSFVVDIAVTVTAVWDY